MMEVFHILLVVLVRSLKLEELYTKKFEELVNCIMEILLIEIKKWETESWKERIWPQTWQICDADENLQRDSEVVVDGNGWND